MPGTTGAADPTGKATAEVALAAAAQTPDRNQYRGRWLQAVKGMIKITPGNLTSTSRSRGVGADCCPHRREQRHQREAVLLVTSVKIAVEDDRGQIV